MNTYVFAYFTRTDGHWRQQYTVIHALSRWRAYLEARRFMPKRRLALAVYRVKW